MKTTPMKKECRNCRCWKRDVFHDTCTGTCTNPKSKRFKQTPLYNSSCKNCALER